MDFKPLEKLSVCVRDGTNKHPLYCFTRLVLDSDPQAYIYIQDTTFIRL